MNFSDYDVTNLTISFHLSGTSKRVSTHFSDIVIAQCEQAFGRPIGKRKKTTQKKLQI